MVLMLMFSGSLAPVPFLVAWIRLLESSIIHKPWRCVASRTGRHEPLALCSCSAHLAQVPLDETGFPE